MLFRSQCGKSVEGYAVDVAGLFSAEGPGVGIVFPAQGAGGAVAGDLFDALDVLTQGDVHKCQGGHVEAVAAGAAVELVAQTAIGTKGEGVIAIAAVEPVKVGEGEAVIKSAVVFSAEDKRIGRRGTDQGAVVVASEGFEIGRASCRERV